jgi:PKD repeat protein
MSFKLLTIKNMKIILYLFLSLFAGLTFHACKDDETLDLLPPIVDFNFTPSAPIEGQEILFYADRMEDSGPVSSWNWSFSDEAGSTSSKRNPYFSFNKAGTYPVTLKVLNAEGAFDEVTKSVVVAPPPKEFMGELIWSFSNNTPVKNINEGSNAPAIGDDGTIYFIEGNAAAQSKIVSVTDKGSSAELKWATVLGNQASNAPSIGPDGNLYINTWAATRSVAKINATNGEIMWSGAAGTGVSNNTSAIDAQGNIYHGSRYQNPNGGAYSWSSSGEKRWEILGVGAFYAAPVINKEGNTVYFLNTTEGKLWAVNMADGATKWEASVGMGSGTHGSSLSINSDGTIYYTTNAHVVAITDNGATGSVKWASAVTGAAQSGVVIGPNGDLYTGTSMGLVALDPVDGSLKWSYAVGMNECVPAVDLEGNIYFGTIDGKLIVVNHEGLLVKEFQLGTGTINSPTITSNGTVYVEGLDDGAIRLFKIAVKESGPANSPWPMKGKNIKNTGHAD